MLLCVSSSRVPDLSQCELLRILSSIVFVLSRLWWIVYIRARNTQIEELVVHPVKWFDGSSELLHRFFSCRIHMLSLSKAVLNMIDYKFG